MRKIIIFDLDNTFYNYQNSHSSALKAVFSFQNEFDDYKEFYIKYEEAKKKVQKRLPDNPSRHSKLIYFYRLEICFVQFLFSLFLLLCSSSYNEMGRLLVI